VACAGEPEQFRTARTIAWGTHFARAT